MATKEQEEKAWENRWKVNNNSIYKAMVSYLLTAGQATMDLEMKGDARWKRYFKNFVAMWNLVIKGTLTAKFRKQ